MASKKLKYKVTLDEATLYVARGCEIHPDLDQFILNELQHLQRMGKVSLTPKTILELYTRRMRKVA